MEGTFDLILIFINKLINIIIVKDILVSADNQKLYYLKFMIKRDTHPSETLSDSLICLCEHSKQRKLLISKLEFYKKMEDHRIISILNNQSKMESLKQKQSQTTKQEQSELHFQLSLCKNQQKRCLEQVDKMEESKQMEFFTQKIDFTSIKSNCQNMHSQFNSQQKEKLEALKSKKLSSNTLKNNNQENSPTNNLNKTNCKLFNQSSLKTYRSNKQDQEQSVITFQNKISQNIGLKKHQQLQTSSILQKKQWKSIKKQCFNDLVYLNRKSFDQEKEHESDFIFSSQSSSVLKTDFQSDSNLSQNQLSNNDQLIQSSSNSCLNDSQHTQSLIQDWNDSSQPISQMQQNQQDFNTQNTDSNPNFGSFSLSQQSFQQDEGNNLEVNIQDIGQIVNFKVAFSEQLCIVCLEQFKFLNQIVKLRCGHYFHEQCMIPWIRNKRNCPTCRNQY